MLTELPDVAPCGFDRRLAELAEQLLAAAERGERTRVRELADAVLARVAEREAAERGGP
jgi:hypothetical protein